MRSRQALALLALSFVIGSCTSDGPTAPAVATLRGASASLVGPLVRVSEIHYDNASTDVGEAIEISGPAGTSLVGWSLVLYNGASTSRATYGTRALTATVPATCDARGVVVESYPVNGIQNGNPDGFALVDTSGVVVEFLSYGGTFTAVNGPAAGMTSVDIGVMESGTTPAGSSLQRTEAGPWTGPIASTFGACNDGTTNDPPPPAVAAVILTTADDTITVGDSVRLSATAVDSVGTPVGATFTWSSLDTIIATVDGTGLVTAMSEGVARIVVSVDSAAADTATITVVAGSEPPGLPVTRFSEIHYDNDGTDTGEAIEIEGPAGTSLAGWSIVLYNQTGGVTYSTTALSQTIPAQCDGRGTIVLNYPANGIQNGPADGFALVDAGGVVVEFLSYEGSLTATNGPATGLTSSDIGVSEASNTPIGRSLHRDAAGVWSGPTVSTFGACNGGGSPPPPPANSVSFGGRLAADPPLPVGFEDQLFATLRSGTGTVLPTAWTWTSETPTKAIIDGDGVMRALDSGTAVIRATAEDGTTATYTLPTAIGVASLTASYVGNAEFGEPSDSTPTDDIIIRRAQYVTSFNPVTAIPNWVSYDLEATHFGPEDRCDCFTFDPELPASVARYNTASYTGAGAAAGYGIDRGHLVRSFDRTAGSLDNANTYYFSNIIPQAADNNQGPWAAMENHLGNLARVDGREVYIIAGASGAIGTVKNEGRITIPAFVWKVALVLPRDAGLSSVGSWADVEVIAAVMPNVPGIRDVDWQTYRTTVDSVESLSGYDLLALMRDDIEIAVESGTRPPVAALDGPWSAYAGDLVTLSATASGDADGDSLQFDWDLGDGSTAGPGPVVGHVYAAPGDYIVRVVVTDPLGLADTASAAVNVSLLPTAVGIARAQAEITSLLDSARVSRGEATSLRAKLATAASAAERGSTEATLGALGAFLNELDAMMRSGRLTEEDVAAAREVIERVRRNLGG